MTKIRVPLSPSLLLPGERDGALWLLGYWIIRIVLEFGVG
jgi:hypothetical protein